LSPTVSLGDLEISYDDLAPSAADGGLPLVLLHGFTGHRDDFAGVRDALARDRRVLIPDVRGHGAASRPPGVRYDFESAREDLRAFLDAVGVERCHLLGHSMGGMLVLRFVLAYPDSVASLILMDTSPDRPAGMEAGPLQAGAHLAREHGMDGLQQRIETATRAAGEPAPYRARWGERYWEHHRLRYHEMDPVAYDEFGRAMVEQSSLVPRLGEIRCPALIIVGEDDSSFLPGARAMAADIANARHVLIADAEHHPHEENREAWLEAVARHLAEHDPVDTARGAI